MTGRIGSAQGSRITILAIATDNTWAHVYPAVEDLLADNDIGAGPGERRGALEFFDANGSPLAPVFNSDWQLQRLAATDAAADPPAVLQRLAKVEHHSRWYIAEHPEEMALFGLEPDEALTLVPNMGGEDLAADLALLRVGVLGSDAGGLGDEDSGGWWHNLRHRAGWKHD